MGNSSSQWQQQQQQQLSRQQPQQSWANSYPREGRGRPAGLSALGPGVAKVLPERAPGRRLRLTDNGAILSGGGTISGRRDQHADEHPRPEFRARSTSVHAPPTQQQQQQPPLQQRRRDALGQAPQLMRFGSEPDLRMRDAQPSRNRLNNSRGRKKYRAPAPPPAAPGDAASSSPDSGRWEEPRRLRLFKTRAETRRAAPSRHAQPPAGQPQPQPQPQHPPLARSLSSPEFQAELLRAAQRLRPLSRERQRQRQQPLGQDASPQPPTTTTATASDSNGNNNNDTNNNGSAADKHWEILPPPRRRQKERAEQLPQRVPARSFYFGMEHGERDAVDRFAASLQRRPTLAAGAAAARLPGGSLSSGEASEEEEDDEEEAVSSTRPGRGGIALQLRPTLPKKQPEVPRFSPTAAWRLLSALEHPASPATSTAGDDASVLLEERIQRLSRPVAPPPPQAPRSKSGDSGISGDASPGREDSLLPAPPPPPPPPATAASPAPAPQAWTPQQDLGDESSSDGEGRPTLPLAMPQARFSPRAHHVFSLSLPRDDRLCLALYAPDDDSFLASKAQEQAPSQVPAFNSLQKLRRSVSGALGAALGSLGRDLGASDDEDELDRGPCHGQRPPLDENWLLSRSVPTSLNVHSATVGRTPSPELPPDVRRDREKDKTHRWNWEQAKEKDWCVSREQRASQSNQHLSDTDATPKKNKGRRFTFQSTVRQIERRRLAERLSREAELKEKQRLSELEAMRQVEEEFQRKRAREKANIRQQLRLFSLDEQLYSSLPAGWGGARAEPDGAASPQPSPPPASSPITGTTTATSTQVLSEYREPRREYRDYRPSSRYNDSSHESLSYMEKKRATVHPQIVCDIPKNSHVYVKPHHQSNGLSGASMYQAEDHGGVSTPHSSSSDNYRRELAHGGRPAGYSLASSDSESNMKPPACLINHSRSRSSSPEHSSETQNVEDLSANVEKQEVDSMLNSVDQESASLPPLQVTTSRTDNTHRLSFTSLQPFVRNSKGYRPIMFNPGTSTNHKVAQTVN
ncbi:serine/arginine repetitive matrix protein 1-like isoform X5 [Schistocerca gregaria]|uniref:serine/arginine repetitive matrix protein 1-like isoform X5 n=1 Tax=Schistocerca gregaria TaxID=7010 RepID=UPI00211E97D2|nr:serine/arginine repetitive matrix protein 1-like isoform X5 [Schistocerca gregaria]